MLAGKWMICAKKVSRIIIYLPLVLLFDSFVVKWHCNKDGNVTTHQTKSWFYEITTDRMLKRKYSKDKDHARLPML